MSAPAPEHTFISEWIVGKTLGQGAYGVVKQGVHWKSNELVALKIIPEEHLKTVRTEIETMRLLDHPHIVKLIDVVHIPQQKQVCLVLEHMDGGDLFEHITSKKKLSERAAARFFRQLLKAVYHCHTNGVVHRDLKPENLLLDSRGKRLKLIDFGLSSIIRPGVLLESNCGSALYAAPEIIQKKKYIGPEVDIWSLGVVLYAMTTGCLPWAGKARKNQLDNIVIGNYVPPQGVSDACAEVIRRCLTVDPKNRATLLELFVHPWVNQGHAAPVASLPFWKPVSRKEIDHEIIKEMGEIGFHKDTLIHQLEHASAESQAEPAVTMYYLLWNYKIKAQEQPKEESSQEDVEVESTSSYPTTKTTRLRRDSESEPLHSQSATSVASSSKKVKHVMKKFYQKIRIA